MSLKIPLSNLTNEDREKIERDLVVKPKETKYNMYNRDEKTIYPYSVFEDAAYLPFSYAHNILGFERPDKLNYPKANINFTGTLRQVQEEIKNEAVKSLNEKGSCLISLEAGCGKCLGYNTPVLLYNGKIKPVQFITTSDLLMGDDSFPRKVHSVTSGIETMYKITEIARDKYEEFSYTVNESHILSLVMIVHDPNVIEKVSSKYIDINIKDYFNLPFDIKSKLYGYRRSVQFNTLSVNDTNFFNLGVWLGKDDDDILFPECFNYDTHLKYINNNYLYNTREVRFKIIQGILSTCRKTDFPNNLDKCLRFSTTSLHLSQQVLFLARSLGIVCYKIKDENPLNTITLSLISLINIITYHIEFPDITSFSEIYSHSVCPYSFKIEKLEGDFYYGFEIDGNRRFLLGDFTVTHNTITSLYLASKIKMPTLITTPSVVLFTQWEDEINKVCPGSKSQILDTKTERDPEADFIIINTANIPKKGRRFFEDIGLVICDEAHLVTTPSNIKAFQYLTPRYMIALTATPERPDGLDKLLDLYFGPERIVKHVKCEHIVYKITTKFQPEIKYNNMGKIDWNYVLDSQATNVDRNELIINIILLNKDRKFLILSKRIKQIEYLVTRLKEEKESVFGLYDKIKKVEGKPRVIIATIKKAGVGFNCPYLDTLILAGDAQEFYKQYLRRVMRREDVFPYIYDLVDDHPLLKKHYKEREKVCIENGGKIKEYNNLLTL